jgi:S-DNA-T family DNA segregation ATPase FtsK/SpoIIIE
MLYMAGGGRISRVHGPFVSDNEVEKVVAHLKTQGQPDYLDAITAEDDPEGDDAPAPGSMDAEESGDLYDRAVNIVLRDRKCSTSYIQRRLSVGYNKAASLVERMEKEGVVGPANHAGKREILVGGGVDRGAFDAGADD